MSEQIKPCRCGHSGRLDGVDNGLWQSLTCPACEAKVEAFTLAGLIEAWNAKAEAAKEPTHDN